MDGLRVTSAIPLAYVSLNCADSSVFKFWSQLLDNPKFRVITKIKTIGSTYMAASGVTPDVNTNGFTSSNKVAAPSTAREEMGLCLLRQHGAATPSTCKARSHKDG